MEELERLRTGIFEIFVERFDTRLASGEVDLLEARLVDSVKLVDLVLEIEDFRTVSRLAERIARNPAVGI